MNDDYLSALALLKASSDEHGANYLDYITPFVADAIRSTGRDSLRTDEIRTALLTSYGLDVPGGVLNTITKRLSRQNLGSRSHGRFMPSKASLADTYNFDIQRKEIEHQIDQLSSSLITFAVQTFGRKLTDHEATKALTTYAMQNGLSIIRTAHGMHTLSTSLSLKEEDYITSRFVVDVFEKQLSEMDTLIVLAKGSKLASVLYLPDPNDVLRNINSLTAFIDTPTLLSALGYQGRTQQEGARVILDIAYEIGIDLAVFDHTVDETESVLRAAALAISRGAHPRRAARAVESHFLNLDYAASDVEMHIGQLEQDLRSIRIDILERPEMRIDWSVDEATLEEELLQAVRYPRREPMLHDLEALTAIFRLRRGRTPRSFENCRAIFITPNVPLARAARDFFDREAGEHWPVAITDDDFATLVWLKRPLAAPELPMRRVIADAYAALEPGLVSWDTYLIEIDKLRANDRISEADYFFLRYSSAAKDALMDETLGVIDRISMDAVEAFLEDYKTSIRSPLEKEVSQQSKSHESFRREVAAHEADLEERLRDAELSRNRSEQQAASANRTIEHHRNTARNRATRDAQYLCRIATSIPIAVLTIGLWFSLPSSWEFVPDRLPSWGQWIARGSVLMVAGATLASLLTGWQVVNHMRRVEVRLSKWLERRYIRKYFGITE